MVAATGVFATALFFFVRYRRRTDTDVTPARDPRAIHEVLFIGVPLTLFLVWFAIGFPQYVRLQPPPPDAHGRLRPGQEVDVEVRVPGRPELGRHAARAGGPAGAAPHHLARRDPLVLRAGAPRQDGRAARPLHADLVHRRPARAATRSSAPSTAGSATRRCSASWWSCRRRSSTAGWRSSAKGSPRRRTRRRRAGERVLPRSSIVDEGRRVAGRAGLPQVPLGGRLARTSARPGSTSTCASEKLKDGRTDRRPTRPTSRSR